MKDLVWILLAILIVLFGCSRSEPSQTHERTFHGDLPAAEDLSTFANFKASRVAQLPAFTDLGGYIAGRGMTWLSQGDAALFTSLTGLALTCEQRQPYLDTIVHSIHDHGGMIPRHDPDVASANGPSTRDQVSGVALFFVDTFQACPQFQPEIITAWTEHVSYVEKTGALGPTADGALLTFHWLWGAVGQYFGVAGAGGGSKQEWEAGLTLTAEGIVAELNACYPIHIGTIQAITAAKIGQAMSGTARAAFCDSTHGLDLPMTRWYCEDEPAARWLATFQPDVWAYRHQRCPAWESPDAQGAHWLGTDFLALDALAGG